MDISTGGMFVVSVCLEGMLKVWKVDRNLLRTAALNSSFDQTDVTILNHIEKKITNQIEITRSYASVIAHESEIHSLAISPNDKLVATSSSDRLIKIWRLPKLEIVGTLKGHRRAVWSVKFSPTEQVKLKFIKIEIHQNLDS